MTTKVGFFPQNNTLWVARHRDLLPGVEWVDLNALGRGERVDPTRTLPSGHGDHLFDGGYDFIGTGSTPPVTAQAKGHDIVYVAISEPRVENGRLVVREDSPIGSVAELKGRRVALGHGSWQTTLLLLALEREGLGWGDIVPVDAYGDAAQLLVNGDVDAWVGSYPYLTPVESRTRTLVETDGLFSHRSLWFTRRDFARERPEEPAGRSSPRCSGRTAGRGSTRARPPPCSTAASTPGSTRCAPARGPAPGQRGVRRRAAARRRPLPRQRAHPAEDHGRGRGASRDRRAGGAHPVSCG